MSKRNSDNRVRVGIIGSFGFASEESVKALLYKLKSRFGPALIVLSGGRTSGAEYNVRKFALQFNIEYNEYNPSYSGQNAYSMEKEEYYGKNYHVSHNIHRYKQLIYRSDFIFILKEKSATDSELLQVIKFLKPKKKPFIIINQ